ncbi:Cytochrome b5 [Coemansia spiralis]|nr:Cytochrome b5 [Coemansia spiralis]
MTDSASSAKKFVAAEIAKHNTRKDIWIVISNNVYDVTGFLEEHPGGEEVILEYAGRDATEAFEDIGHSDDARDMLKEFMIGKLEVTTRPAG